MRHTFGAITLGTLTAAVFSDHGSSVMRTERGMQFAVAECTEKLRQLFTIRVKVVPIGREDTVTSHLGRATFAPA